MVNGRKRRRIVVTDDSSPNVSVESIESLTDPDQSTSDIARPTGSFNGIFKRFSSQQVEVDDNDSNDALWVEKYAPRNPGQISINKQKLGQVRESIGRLVNGQASDRILVLSGPPGCGKSTTAKIVAEKAMQANHQSTYLLDDPNVNETTDFSHVVEYSNRTTTTSRISSPVTQFSDFLDECKLLTSGSCILVDELPNLYHEPTLMNFRHALLNWIEIDSHVQLPPLIICITEFDVDDERHNMLFTLESTFKVETVLGRNLMQYEERGWHRIKFNSIARSFMKKGLRSVANREKLTIPKSVVTKEIDELSATGDIRNGLITFEYWARFLYPITNEISTYLTLGEISSLNIFHSVGKVVYGTQHPKEELDTFMRSFNMQNSLKQKLSRKPTMADINTITVENISQDVASTSERLNLNILENYLVLNPDIGEDTAKLIDILSESDTMVKYGFDDSQAMVGYYSCFGSRIQCSKMKTPGQRFGKLRYSRESKVRQKKRKIGGLVSEFIDGRAHRLVEAGHYAHISREDVMLVDGFYQYSIIGSMKDEMASGYKVQRIGGDFSNLILPKTKIEEEGDDSLEKAEYTKQLEARYFNYGQGGTDPSDDEEFANDPIEDSEEEDSFSDDSLVLGL